MKYIYILLTMLLTFASCGSDFLDGEESKFITGSDIEKDKNSAASLMNGAYRLLYNPEDFQDTHDDFGLPAIDIATDAMADDFITFNTTQWFSTDYKNDNRASSYRRPKKIWLQLYAVIRTTNKVVAKLDTVTVDEDALNIKAQALALRGYSYFMLINLFQQPYSVNKQAPGVPIYTNKLDLPGRNTVDDVYKVILDDLLKSYDILKGSKNENPVKLDGYSVSGMLARVLCFVNDYPDQWKEVAKYADIAASGVSLSDKSQLLGGFNSLPNLGEVLWGSDISNTNNTFYASYISHMASTASGYGGKLGQYKCISSYLYNKIDVNDIRLKWFDGSAGNYKNLKFKDVGQFRSDYIFMRASEMYFIKAEALYLSGDEAGAKNTLKTVMVLRNPSYNSTQTGTALLDEIRIQKRIEMWGEGKRLFDMKWRGEAMDRTTSTNHFSEYTTQLPANPKEYIFQIPLDEMDANPEIKVQNPY